MADLLSYATVTSLNEGMFLYTRIDTDSDGDYESRKFTLASLRAKLNDLNGTQQLLSKGADVASATALALGTDGNSFDITGTTTITSIVGLGVGAIVVLQFDASLTLTHHATDLILPSGADIITAAGDIGIFYEYASGDWRCISYQRAAGTSPVILPAAMDAVTDTAACSVANYFSTLTTTGAAVPTLANGIEGQMKKIQMIVDVADAVLTPATLTGGTTITFADVGDTAEPMFTKGSWQVLALYNIVDGATAPVLA